MKVSSGRERGFIEHVSVSLTLVFDSWVLGGMLLNADCCWRGAGGHIDLKTVIITTPDVNCVPTSGPNKGTG
jgi:hypothetical protein